MAHKFIITTNATFTETPFDEYQIRMANVNYHNELMPKDFTGRVKGGGYFHIDSKMSTVYLYGKSEEFGYAAKDKVVQALNRSVLLNRLYGYIFFVSNADSLSEAILIAEQNTPDYVNA